MGHGLAGLRPFTNGAVHILRIAHHQRIHLVLLNELGNAGVVPLLRRAFDGLHTVSNHAQEVADGDADGSCAHIQGHFSHIVSPYLLICFK